MTFPAQYYHYCLAVFALLACLHYGGQAYQHDFYQDHTHVCLPGQIITEVQSTFNGRDRKWNVTCSPAPGSARTIDCQWNAGPLFINEADGEMLYQCPGQKVVTGMASVHKGVQSDRLYKTYCCDVEGHVPHECFYTRYINAMQGDMDYTLPSGNSLRGLYSYHNNKREDRQFQLNVCRLDALELDTSG
ncbi:hypothetical protein RRG08_000262 [Elysia crispata]|uniref:Dermatopontin n=1 Tax=Elysia crispata TaxID=231223 RepID=A0AAE1CUV5_9GAST|nr:hypothetical protein RRG08_000262 [Elysia crispata]